MSGILYLCATPIGNLEDITFRVIRVLKEADLIAAEDTRNSIKLLNHFDIHTPMTSYHEFNKMEKGRYLVEQLREGKNIALITDAGTPGISDPGEELVSQCHEAGIPVTETRTIIIYEAPHRLVKTLDELRETLGNRRMTLCRELTKKHETCMQTTFDDLITFYKDNKPLGECVLVIEGVSHEELQKEEQQAWMKISIEEHVEMYEKEGLSRKEAMKRAAKERGISKRDIYQSILRGEE